MEFELLDGIPEMFAEAEAGAAEMELGEAAEVEDNAAVAEVADAPAIAEGDPGAGQQIRDFINNNPYGRALWSFATWAGSTTATAGAVFGIMYGLNRATAKKAQQTGNRTALSVYLQGVEANWAKLNLGPFTQDQRQKAAEDALAFPWIDATQ